MNKAAKIIAGLCLVLFVLNAIALFQWGTRSYPERWEAGIIVEAQRSALGLPVYRDASVGHSTHMYGPLLTWVLGRFFSLFGPNNYTARVLNFISALAVIGILVVLLTRGKPFLYQFIAFCLLFAINGQTNHYFVASRPDMMALFLSTVSLLLFFYSWEKPAKRVLSYTGAVLFLLSAFFLKQNYAFIAIVPCFLGLQNRKAIPFILTPVILLVLILFAVQLIHPWMFHYMIKVPASYPLYGYKIAKNLLYLVVTNPLFLVAFFLKPRHFSKQEQWILSTVVFSTIASTLAYAKHGGVSNSNLPTYFAMYAFVLIRLDSLICFFNRVRYQGVLVFILVLAFYPYGESPKEFMKIQQERSPIAYQQIIEGTKKLEGTIACPDDPTIPLYAVGQLSKSGWLERDNWRVLKHLSFSKKENAEITLQKADHVVGLQKQFSRFHNEILPPEILEDFGFQRKKTIGPYTLWSKKG